MQGKLRKDVDTISAVTYAALVTYTHTVSLYIHISYIFQSLWVTHYTFCIPFRKFHNWHTLFEKREWGLPTWSERPMCVRIPNDFDFN